MTSPASRRHGDHRRATARSGRPGRIRLKMRGTVSTLWAKHLGPGVEDLGRPARARALKSGTRISTPVPGLSSWIWRIVSAYSHGAAVGQVVAGDAGDGGVAQAHLLHGLGDPARLVAVEVLGAAGVDLAEVAAPGALVAADEERRLAVLPALEDVGAARLLAHRVQALGLHQRAQLGVLRAHLRRRRIHSGLRSIGVSALRASTRSIRRPSGATLTKAPLPCAGQRVMPGSGHRGRASDYARARYRPRAPTAARGRRAAGRTATGEPVRRRGRAPPYRTGSADVAAAEHQGGDQDQRHHEHAEVRRAVGEATAVSGPSRSCSRRRRSCTGPRRTSCRAAASR